jgi:voltage-gated potassium channel Kch
MVSAVSAPVVTRFPNWSSLDTLKVVRTVLAGEVVGGSVENANFLTAAGVIVIDVTVAVPPEVLSVAVNVQEEPAVSRATSANVATSDTEV